LNSIGLYAYLTLVLKFFTKVATNRIIGVAQKVISPTQTAFIPERNIMEGVVILDETIHEMHRKNKSGVIFKIDFEKAYDKVKWSFVQQTLRMKGFSPKWCQWIVSFVQGGHVDIKVNDQIGNNFQTYKGLKQGDPLSPILFNIVADMLALLIKRAKDVGTINGVIPHLVDDGLSILQYADDTIIFLEHDLQQAKNLKLILSVFEKLSGLKINFHKSELFCFGQAKDFYEQYSTIFGCKLGTFPVRYLGIPMHFRKVSYKDWKVIEQRIEKKLSSWKGKHMSVRGRLVLINSVLSSLAMFMISFFRFQKGFFKKLIIIDQHSFGKGMIIRKSTDLQDGILFANPKIRVVWVSII
jgi:hypothetical protein